MMKKLFCLMPCVLVLFVVGCNGSQTANSTSGSTGSSVYLATTEPSGAVPVGEARKNAKTDEEVTLVGLIGGSSEPFVDGMAAFTIVDAKVPYCAPDEGCPTPWDYCCQTAAVKDNIATVQIVDGDGKPVMSDARKLLNVKELATVVLQGKAKRDAQGNLTVSTSKLFVRSSK
jgi:hypothetical protein